MSSPGPYPQRPAPDHFVRRWLVITACVAALMLFWQFLPAIEAWFSPRQAAERTVTPRDDLAADEQATIELFEKSRASVVYITTAQLVRDVWTRNVFSVPRGTGSGFIWDDAGHVVTNFHVIQGASEATVKLADGRDYQAALVGASPAHDIAVLKIGIGFKRPPAVPVGTSADLKVGQKVFAIGNPFGLDWTLTTGIVSALDRSLPGEAGGPAIDHLVQTDAAINPGNSGGALVNAQGELVGINSMLYSQTGSYSGYGFAIPTAIMNKVVDDLKKYGSVQRAMLGITGSDVLNYINSQKEDGKDVDLGTNEGVYVNKVEDDGAAAEAGMVKGDVLTMIDGKQITKTAEMQEVLAGKRPGDKVTITYLHNKNKHTKTVTLKNSQGTTEIVKPADLDVLGGNFREVTEAQKKQLGISYGVEVVKVAKGALQNAGVARGFIIQKVNDTPVKTIDELQKLVKSASTSKDPVLYVQGVWPTGKKAYFAIPLDN